MTVCWRLIDTDPCTGSENMAIDEALFHCFDPSSSRPVLRLYGWQPATLSLGRYQRAAEDLDLARCVADQVSVVRRITGGGAIYHADELTYSLVCSPDQIPPATSVKDSFRALTSFLLCFYQSLGLKAAYALEHTPPESCLGERTTLCFAGRESYDILIHGRKIGGNAQRRSRKVIFQHGSIPLKNRAADGLSYLKHPPPGIEQMTTSLRDEGILQEETILKQLLAQQFTEKLGVVLAADVMTDHEQKLSRQLAVGKYQNNAWNLEGKEA